ncbi:MAG: hypothetical protein ABFS23_13375, partial [Pseudomonadota bacterium]
RENRCPACGRATHVCRNCRFYSPGRSNDCAEPVAEYVADKERPNFCDYFQAVSREGTGPRPSADGLRDAAEDLFK